MEEERRKNKVEEIYDASQIQILKGLEAVRRDPQCISVMLAFGVCTI